MPNEAFILGLGFREGLRSTQTSAPHKSRMLVSHPEAYNGSEYLNICRVTDITRSVNSIHQVSVVRTPIVRKKE